MAARKRPSGPARSGARRGEGRRIVRAPQAYNGAIRSQLEELQRARIVSATFDVAAERGAANMSVAHVVERAGVSRRTFYEIFTDREDALLAAFTDAAWHASERVLPAYESEKAWREKTRAGLIGLLSFFDEQPLMARLLIVESLAGGPVTQHTRSEIAATLTSVIEQGRAESKAPETIPPLTGEGIVGGVLTVLHTRIAANRREPRAMSHNERILATGPAPTPQACSQQRSKQVKALSCLTEACVLLPNGQAFRMRKRDSGRFN